MSRSVLLFFIIMLPCRLLIAQNRQDSISAALPGVTVRAYEQNRKVQEVAAPIGIIDQKTLNRYSVNSLLPAVNTIPGVKMEERSPGSYRLNIRGSSLRSPFGVRNVKIYLNGIPFTDPGGGTYLNQLSPFDISGIEILKSPGSSLYGAGTGGVLLINTLKDSASNLFSATVAGGSYNTYNLHFEAGPFSYTHQVSDGYRQQSAMRRDLFSWQSVVTNTTRKKLSVYALYGDLHYETPGGLTKAQYLTDSRAARPPGAFPGAVDNKAAISQKTFWAGVEQQYHWNKHFENSSSLYGAFSQVKNPAILNYERRLEPHAGGRTTFSYSNQLGQAALKIIAGAELQQGYFSVKVYNNKAGNPDSLQTDDEINNRQLSVFTQATLNFSKGWIAMAGISFNKTSVTFNRLSIVPPFMYSTHFNNEWSPRISLLKRINGQLSVYGVVSEGFSPPAISELLPSTTIINTSLQAEHGINYETGMRGSFFHNRLFTDLSAYYFDLSHAITQRRDDSGADYFINAGSVRQKGLEALASYELIGHPGRFISNARIWTSFSVSSLRYAGFKQASIDYTGNRVPGVAPFNFTGGVDITTRQGIYLNITYSGSSHIALNDANSEYADAYQLPGFRAGYKRLCKKNGLTADLFISGDNLLNRRYSLGNDINAQGGRYYNAAPGRNFQAGLIVSGGHAGRTR